MKTLVRYPKTQEVVVFLSQILIKKNLKAGFFEDESEEDRVIPDPKLRNILNENFEIIVSDSIYKVTSRGVLYSNIKDANKLRSITENQLSQFKRMDDNTLTFNNVALYESFKNLPEEQTENENVTPTPVALSRSGAVPYDSFEIVGIDKHTIVGKWIQKFFGVDKKYHVYLRTKLRLTAGVFAYDYRFMSRAGFKGEMEHRTLIRTWPTLSSWGHDQTIEFNKIIFSAKNPNPQELLKILKILIEQQYRLLEDGSSYRTEFYRELGEDKAVEILKNSDKPFHTIITLDRVYRKMSDFRRTTKDPVNVFYLQDLPRFEIVGTIGGIDLAKTIKAMFSNVDLVTIHAVDAYIYTLGEGDGKYYGFHFLRNN